MNTLTDIQIISIPGVKCLKVNECDEDPEHDDDEEERFELGHGHQVPQPHGPGSGGQTILWRRSGGHTILWSVGHSMRSR